MSIEKAQDELLQEINAVGQSLAVHKERIAQLEQYLRMYGKHLDWCPKTISAEAMRKAPCGCGLSDVLTPRETKTKDWVGE